MHKVTVTFGEGISPGAPVQAALRAKLDAVLAEQDDRARMAAGA